jgi:hypothetical protein
VCTSSILFLVKTFPGGFISTSYFVILPHRPSSRAGCHGETGLKVRLGALPRMDAAEEVRIRRAVFKLPTRRCSTPLDALLVQKFMGRERAGLCKVWRTNGILSSSWPVYFVLGLDGTFRW